MAQLGKYGSDRDNILHYLCTSDWSNDSFGNVEAPTGFVWRISNTPEEVQMSNTELTSVIEDQMKAYDIEDNQEFRDSLVGHFLVAELSSGEVFVRELPSESELDRHYSALGAKYAEWDTED